MLILIIFLLYSLWKWWSYKRMCEGLIYFALKEHKWVIDDMEIKKILNFSIKKNMKDLF